MFYGYTTMVGGGTGTFSGARSPCPFASEVIHWHKKQGSWGSCSPPRLLEGPHPPDIALVMDTVTPL